MNKWLKKWLFIVISFFILGSLFSCKNLNRTNVIDEKENCVITFTAMPEALGTINATVDGTPIKSGEIVKKDKEVIFTLIPENNYTIDNWEGAFKDSNNILMAKLKVSKSAKIVAKLKKAEPKLELSSLEIFTKKLDISNLKNIKTEVDYDVATISSKNIIAMFTYGNKTIPEQIKVSIDKSDLAVGENIVNLSISTVKEKYQAWEQQVKITRKGKEKFTITFLTSHSDFATINATVDGTPIKSGESIEKDKEVIFTLIPKDVCTIDEWIGAIKDNNNPLVAHLKVFADATITAKLKQKQDTPLTLKSLNIHNKNMDITNLTDMKVEVENFVKALNSNDVIATFTYGLETIPKELIVIVDKNILNEGETLVKLSVPAVVGKYKDWNKEVKIIRKLLSPTNPIPQEIKVDAIEMAIYDENIKLGNFMPIANFNNTISGPYEAEEAKIAYVTLKLKIEKPASGEDFFVEVVNKTTYIKPLVFLRSPDGDDNYFVLKRKYIEPKTHTETWYNNPIILSKGYNVLEIKVKSPDKKEGIYNIIVKYDGGPNPLASSLEMRKILSGAYCPAQRKPLEGEKPDFVYLISIAGWCQYCGGALSEVGNGNNIADKYKDKGLRVIVVDTDGRKHDFSEAKWKAAGANFPLYDRFGNCFEPIYKDVKGYPSRLCIKEWQGTKIFYESEIKSIFEFN
ncbi:MAG: hypothetical protein ACTTKH_07725 [Treponema sp.]